MKRILAIVLAGSSDFCHAFEILARGGEGEEAERRGRGRRRRWRAAVEVAGFLRSGGASPRRPRAHAIWRPSTSASPSPGGGQKAAARPAGPGAARKAQPGPGRRSGKAAAAGQRPRGGRRRGDESRLPPSRPSSGQLNSFLDVSGPDRQPAQRRQREPDEGAAQRPISCKAAAPQVAAGAAIGGAAGRQRGRTRGADVGRPGTAGQNLAQNRPGRIENRGERQGTRDQRRDEIRNQYNDNNPGNFWEENPGWAAWAITRPFAWATWGSVGSWCGYGGQPTSYSYGEDVYYSGRPGLFRRPACRDGRRICRSGRRHRQ